MKKTFITFVIISLIINQLQAQSSFNEEVFTAMMNRVQTDPAFFKNEVDPSFTAIFGNGATVSRDWMIKFSESNLGFYKRKHDNLKVTQVGNTGIATGIVEESFLSKDNPSITNSIYKEHFIYTFSQVNGKWLWVAGQHTDFRNTKEVDEAAIKKVIEAETLAGWERDTEKEFSYWNHVTNASFIGAAQNNAYYVLGFDNIKNMALDYHKKTPALSPLPTLHNTDYIIKINGNDAFVTYRAEQQYQEGKVDVTRENRYLEKVNGNWKITNVTWIVEGGENVAPNNFDEATFNQMIARWGNDPAGFVKNECDKKFIFTDGNGKTYNYDQAVETYKTAFSKIDKKVENVKVWQSGNTGIATGKTIETYQFKDGKAFTYTGLFTYTFSQSNGKWVLASAQHTDYKAPKTVNK